jgi:hypothetical protein
MGPIIARVASEVNVVSIWLAFIVPSMGEFEPTETSFAVVTE